MILKNTSRYPDAEVRRLIELATKGVNLTCVAVHVKNCRAAYAGRAYQSVPSISSAARNPDADYLITLRVGPPSLFPTDNMVTTVRWVNVPMADALADPTNNHRFGWDSRRGQFAQWRVEQRHPYGGKRSPLIELADWREALVAIAAHESRHVHQFRHGKRRSEVDCEQFAAKQLAVYRNGG